MNIRPSIILIENGKLLTLHYNYDGTDVYALPGGNLEFGEQLEIALARELFEELNIEIEVAELSFVAQVFRKEKNTLHFIFLGKIIKGEPKINPNETTALNFEWLSLEKLTEFNLYPDIKVNLAGNYLKNRLTITSYLGQIEQKWY